MNVANCMQRGTFSGCICYCYKAPECNNRTAKEKTRRYIMYLFARKLNWVGYGAVAVAYIEQLILIRLFLLIQYMNFSMSIFHNFYIQLKEIIFKNLVKDPTVL